MIIKKKLLFALRSLKITIPISFVILAQLWILALLDYDNASKTIELGEWYSYLSYILFWGIPTVVLVWRFVRFKESPQA